MLGERLNATGIIRLRIAYPLVHRVGAKLIGRTGPQKRLQAQRVGRAAVEPHRHLLGRHDDRHPVMYRSHQLVRFGRDDRAGAYFAPFGIEPGIIQAGELEEAAVPPYDPDRLLRAVRLRSPFVEAVRRNEAALALERKAEGRLAAQRLGTGVHGPPADLLVLGPGGDQPPAERADSQLRPVMDDGRDGLSRSDIEAGPVRDQGRSRIFLQRIIGEELLQAYRQ